MVKYSFNKKWRIRDISYKNKKEIT